MIFFTGIICFKRIANALLNTGLWFHDRSGVIQQYCESQFGNAPRGIVAQLARELPPVAELLYTVIL